MIDLDTRFAKAQTKRRLPSFWSKPTIPDIAFSETKYSFLIGICTVAVFFLPSFSVLSISIFMYSITTDTYSQVDSSVCHAAHFIYIKLHKANNSTDSSIHFIARFHLATDINSRSNDHILFMK